MQAFNTFAKEQMQIENAQNEAFEANYKAVALADAKRGVFDQERRIKDT
jgi:hypothetical protein